MWPSSATQAPERSCLQPSQYVRSPGGESPPAPSAWSDHATMLAMSSWILPRFASTSSQRASRTLRVGWR
ncbi:hypothetical protein SCE1572_00680 [Sorangium cellulosum So0157-2]|uniref:Uncharacterized protein n=1 Tax=Sorangium cellulosum So0157-2 TaxID=1254432 RepID=S4XKS2_SORCE|nr:hypothetical protein SCE1572_00680 [Sorangium cellulosum So0157-2]